MKKLTINEIGEMRLRPHAARRADRFPIYVLLDNIRSLYNVGAIFRTADAIRVEKLLLCGITGKPPRREIDKTALGATDTVPWEYHQDGVAAAKALKAQGIPIIALEHTSESQPHWDTDYPFPCCLVIGNEVWGIQDELLAIADMAVELPMYGAKHSLNASVAFGILGYDVLQKLKGKNEG